MPDAGFVQRLLDPARDFRRGHGRVLEAEGHLTVDGRVHGLKLRVLEHEADAPREDPRGGIEDAPARNLGPP